MSKNISKNNNSSDLKPGQTLFDFLKRKKKFALEASLSRSRQKENTSILSNYKNDSNRFEQHLLSPRKHYQDTYRETLKESIIIPGGLKNQDTFRNTVSMQLTSTTPKKVSFADDRERRHTSRSSFIEMISPMKRKISNISGTLNENTTPRQKSISIEKQKPKFTHTHQLFHRKNLNKSINILKSTIQTLLSSAKSIKQKWHSFFIQFKPLLKYVEQSSNFAFAQCAFSLRQKLQTFEYMFSDFSVENGNAIIQQFHQTLSEHLVSLEASLRSTFQKEQIQTYKQVREEKDKVIQDLQADKVKLQKEIELLNKRLHKIQKQSQALKQSSQYHQYRDQDIYNSKVSQLQEKINTYEQQINSLSSKLSTYKSNQKQLQKAVKDLKFYKEQSQRRFLQQNAKVKATKQEFLLNEITILKRQFKSDLEQLTSLYFTKEKEHLTLIEELKQQISDLQRQRSCDKELEGKILTDAALNKSTLQKLRKENESLVSDLHRMNEELYQHWLALKDIKTLAGRLQIFNKFYKIYDDLAFNDQLFI